MSSSSTKTESCISSASSAVPRGDGMSRMNKEFNVKNHIGRGSFGHVFKVKNLTDKCWYAIKMIRLGLDRDENLDKKITKEIRLLSKLCHKNVVQYYGSWIEKSESEGASCSRYSDDDKFAYDLCIQMELCRNTLRHEIKKQNLYRHQDRVWRLIQQCVEGLEFVHSKNIIHRDIKPDNIFINGQDCVKIGDFGLAKLNSAAQGDIKNKFHTGNVGTRLYHAPELKTQIYNEKIDIYSLGLTIFEMCYPPIIFKDEDEVDLTIWKKLRANPPTVPNHIEQPPQKKRSSKVPPEELYYPNKQQTKLIRELLNHDPEERPSATDILKNGYLPFDKIWLRSSAQHVDRKSSSAKISQTKLSYLQEDRRANLLEMMSEKARVIFRCHGGNYSSAYLASDINEESAVFVPKKSYAKYLADHPGITHMKRYTFNEISFESSFMMKSSTSSFKCARFDIASPSQKSKNLNLTMEAEALLIVCEFLERFSGSLHMNECVIRLNHSQLVPLVLNCLKDKYGKKRDNEGNILRDSESYYMNYASEKYALLPFIHDIELDEWQKILADEVESDSPLLSHVFHLKPRDSKYKSILGNTFNDLKRLCDLIKSFDIKCPIVIAPSLMEGYQYCTSMFQVVRTNGVNNVGSKTAVMAAGGRYDNLITECKKDSETKRSQQSAVGLCIYFDYFIRMLEQENNFVSKYDVLVCSVNATELSEQKLTLAKKLWTAHIRCTISYVDYKSLEDIERYCTEMKINYILFLSENSIDRVTLCSWIRDNEFKKADFGPKEVVNHLKKIIKVN